jgi:hypothetical protein
MTANSKLQRFRTSQHLSALVIALKELQHSTTFKICGADCSSPVHSRSHALNRCIPINPTFDRFYRIHAPAHPAMTPEPLRGNQSAPSAIVEAWNKGAEHDDYHPRLSEDCIFDGRDW